MIIIAGRGKWLRQGEVCCERWVNTLFYLFYLINFRSFL